MDVLSRLFCGLAVACFLGATVVGCTNTSDLEPTYLTSVVRLETIVVANRVSAGRQPEILCRGFDRTGEPVPLLATEVATRYSPDTAFVDPGDRKLVAARAGSILATCYSDALGLVDETPEEIEIVAGPLDTAVAHVGETVISAGASTAISCTGYDEFGNRVADTDWRIEVSTAEAGSVVTGASFTTERAGRYEVSCRSSTAIGQSIAAVVDVVPSTPAQVVSTLYPDRSVFKVGDVVEVRTLVTDAYGNRVSDAAVTAMGTGIVEQLGSQHFELLSDGPVVFTASLLGADGIQMESRHQVTVAGDGPSVECMYDGTMVNLRPGEPMNVLGFARDANGLNSVRLNGQLATLRPDGSFVGSIETEFGVNFVDVEATDAYGNKNSRVCTFLVGDTFLPEHGFLDGAIGLQLGQAAFDDGNRAGPRTSIVDFLHTILHAEGFRNLLDAQLRARSTLYDDCAARGAAGECVFAFTIRYEDIQFDGPHDLEVSLVDGGIRVRAVLRNAGIRLDIDGGGTLGWGLDTNGWIRIGDTTADITFNVQMVAGRPRVWVRQLNDFALGEYDLAFDGLVGALVDVLEGPLQDLIRGLYKVHLGAYVRDHLGGFISGFLQNTGAPAYAHTLEVPRLRTLIAGEDEQAPLSLTAGLYLSNFSFSSQEAMLVADGRVTLASEPAHARSSLGVLLPRPLGPIAPNRGNNTVAATLHGGTVNQALHALWRGGFFDDVIPAGEDGFRIRTEAQLPPIAELSGNSVRVSIGALYAWIDIPGLGDPLLVEVGARASMRFTVEPDPTSNAGEGRLVVETPQIEELRLWSPDISAGAESYGSIGQALRNLVQAYIEDSLNEGIPPIAIPSFGMPEGGAAFGFDPETRLGLRDPAVVADQGALYVSGTFGEL